MRKLGTWIMCMILLLGVVQVSVPVQAKVRMSCKKLQMEVGSTKSLKLKGTKKKVKWSSNKKKVVTVSSKGVVKAKKIGKAIVTAKVSGKKYKCKITVINKKKQNDAQEQTSEQSSDQTTQEKKSETKEPTQETTKVDAGDYTITLTHSGEATWYEPTAGGAANLDDFAKGYYTAAMNNEDYMNGLAGAYIEITDKDGDKINVLITDRLPEGKKGDIDLKPDAFEKIEPKVTGRMAITWKLIPLPTDEPIQYVFKPQSTQWWAEVQVRNHRYPVAKLEYLDASTGNYVELPRQEYNYFKAEKGLGGAGPFTFRVTDIYGHQLIDTGIALNTTSTPVKGKANFPY
ncbi:MAG: Ig-like domain-containing protein [Lachnospiraceae bacterium]|nr:Ig-like domain-containing protein [Lachnospiraceae bacterium]